jgi:ribose-phosphate pyrophosphokinase
MKTLNLVYLDKSDIKYRITHFPDGQHDIVLDTTPFTDPINPITDHVNVQARFNSWAHLEIIVCAVKALRAMGIEHIQLFVPYLLGARSDRRFHKGGTNYLAEVVAPVINSLELSRVVVMDPHSDVTAACINNLYILDNTLLLDYAGQQIYGKDIEEVEDFMLVSPDAGAIKKMYKLAIDINYKRDIVFASKHRDVATGKILSTEVPYNGNSAGKDMIVVDDICDGGYTFVELGKILNGQMKRHTGRFDVQGKLYLIVTHGIFSKGLGELEEYYDGIFCTNSVQDIKDSTFVKQLNMFW